MADTSITSNLPDGIPGGAPGARAVRAKFSTCDRPSGTQPRNRQHRFLEYYLGYKYNQFLGLSIVNRTFLLARNPYRTQVIFSGTFTAGSFGIEIGHDGNFPCPSPLTIVPQTPIPIPAAGFVYGIPVILSWPVHGPIVCEEFWAIGTGTADQLTVTEYFYTD